MLQQPKMFLYNIIMNTSDKLLLAILTTVPIEKEKLSIENFNKELLKMGVSKNSEKYNFLFKNKLIEIYESEFMQFGQNKELKIKISSKTKYVFLTEKGQFLLFLLQSILLRENFIKIGENNECNKTSS